MKMYAHLAACGSFALAAVVNGQALDKPDSATKKQASQPLIFRDAGDKYPTDTELRELQDAIAELIVSIRKVQASSVSAAQKEAEVQRLLAQNPRISKQMSSGQNARQPTTNEEAISRLETLLYEVAVEIAPDEASKREGEAEGVGPWRQQDTTGNCERPEVATAPKSPDSPVPDQEQPEEDTAEVEFLASKKVTSELHDDTTVLADISDDDGDLVFFDALRFWIGGAGQYDATAMQGLFTHSQGGQSRHEHAVRCRGSIRRHS
jgi:hypothetical protein